MADKSKHWLVTVVVLTFIAGRLPAQSQAVNTAVTMPTNASVAYTGPTVNFSLANPAAAPTDFFTTGKKYSLLLDPGSLAFKQNRRNLPDVTLYYRLTSNLLFNLATSQNASRDIVRADFTTPEGGNAQTMSWTARQTWAMGLTYRYTPALRLGIAVHNQEFRAQEQSAAPGYQPALATEKSYLGLDLGMQYQRKNLTLGMVVRTFYGGDDQQFARSFGYFGLSDALKTAPNVRLRPRSRAEFGMAWDVLPKTNTQLLADVNTLGEVALGVRQGLSSKATFMAGWARKQHPLFENWQNDIFSTGLEFTLGNVVLSGSIARFFRPAGKASGLSFDQISTESGTYKFSLFDQTAFRFSIGISR